MQKREKILAVVAAAVVLLGGGQFVLGSLKSPFASRQAELAKLETQVAAQRDRVSRAQNAKKKVEGWKQQSLPADVTLARSFYQHWLSELIEKVKLSGAHVQPERTVAVSRTTASRQTVVAYHQLPFTINATGSIDQFVRFFYEFYQADMLHRVRAMSIQPLKEAKQLKISLTVEALVMPGASVDVPTKIPTAHRLALASVDDYQKAIGTRNVFAAYVPPPPAVRPPARVERPPVVPPTPKPPAFDDAKFAIVSAILQVDERPQVWLLVKTSGKLHKLFEGDTLEIGQFKGKVTKISRLDVEFESEGRRQLVALGENLRQAATLPKDEI